MTTESTDAPRAARVRPPSAVPRPPAVAVGPPRASGRATLPPPRPGRGLRRRTVAPLMAADCLAAAGAALLVLGPDAPPALPVAALLALLLLHGRAGLYRPGPAPTALGDLPALLGRGAVCWCATAAVLAAVRPDRALSPALLVLAVSAHGVLVCGGRAAVYRARRDLARRRPRAALIVGADPAARQLAAVLAAHPEYGMRPVGVVPPVPVPPSPPEDATSRTALPRLSSPQDIARAVVQHTVRDAVFTLPPYADAHTAALLRSFVDQGSAIWLAGAAAAREGRTPHPGTDHLWGFACRPLDTAPPRHGSWGKRALDLTLAAPALAALAPVLLGCALALRLADGPGVLLRQECTGRGGSTFTRLTFRTLRRGDGHGATTAPPSAVDDAPASRVGRLLRRTSLDALPQLWNVLRGEMSLVGPSPEPPCRVRLVTRHCPEYADRHRMPAGITGLARVHGLGRDASAEDRARFDNLYIDSWSLWQDIGILLRTAALLLRLEGR
ncbi:sugar transferase [Streptomyces sp. NPDC058989]|uniref:sugar transferase n=1 Tax=Streptomyces sp. NPDC058989 TaxID=3346686 RepID=UPI003697AFFE